QHDSMRRLQASHAQSPRRRSWAASLDPPQRLLPPAQSCGQRPRRIVFFGAKAAPIERAIVWTNNRRFRRQAARDADVARHACKYFARESVTLRAIGQRKRRLFNVEPRAKNSDVLFQVPSKFL